MDGRGWDQDQDCIRSPISPTQFKLRSAHVSTKARSLPTTKKRVASAAPAVNCIYPHDLVDLPGWNVDISPEHVSFTL